MNVLMIGGTGILSTDVCAEAVRQGYNVYILNRGTRKYALNSDAELISADIRKESVQEIRNKISGRFYDIVIDFLSYEVKNVKKTLDYISGLCNQYIFISSATAYMKKDENQVIDESCPVGNPKWEYAYNKAMCEKYIEENYNKYCNTWTVIRPYVTYGDTRIPYAIIPYANWTLINRMLIGKPVVLWDGGKNKCTITHTKDFAVGVVGLFANEKAYANAFHVTSDFHMTWKDVIEDIKKSVSKNSIIVDIDTKYIISILPEYEGVLCGDKSTNMQFNNSKIKNAVPEFKSTIKFSDGIKDTIKYMESHLELQNIDYGWDGRIDYLLEKYYKKNHIKYSKKSLSFLAYNHLTVKNIIQYLANRYYISYKIYNWYKSR